jgi:mono/diheme cytochrome c family protein/heme/copper-type cytochrome/quinol oxidase subunit 3
MSDTPNEDAMRQVTGWAGPGPLTLGLFLAAAVILFGSILTGYILLRVNDPGAFTLAPKLLDRRLGLVAMIALIVACAAAAGAFRFAFTDEAGRARPLLAVSLLAGMAVLAVRVLELPSTSLHAGFLPSRSETVSPPIHGGSGPVVTHVGDAAQGKRIFLGTCAACHAPDGSGVKGQGQNLRDSLYLKGKTDEQALAFVKTGRQPFDPESKLHLAMPARGGNPALSDASLLDAIAYIREFQSRAEAQAAAPAAAVATARPAAGAPASDQPQVIDGELWLPHSILPAASAGPSGSSRATVALQIPGAEGREASNVRRFFSLVLLLSGLHSIYLLFGVAIGAWLLVPGRPGRIPRLPLAMLAAYWIVIAGIGVLLIPALYI